MKDKIWHHFLLLMLEEKINFNEIRVGDLCQRANIHRSTFYRHFEDKYQLLEYGLDVLWFDYFEEATILKVRSPFQTAQDFFESSQAKRLIDLHHADEEFIKLADQFFLRKMLMDFEVILKQVSTDLPKDLLAYLMTSSIQVIEEWAETQPEKLSSAELDAYYQKSILENLAPELFE